MPLQNRVDPYGTLFRTTARGTFMGNRGGAIHNEQREIVRPFLNRRWISCVLEFRGRKRTVMTPNRYTELFFLDEAVSFAAGHRPCAECRRERFNAFREAWSSWDRSHQAPLRADYMDEILHSARVGDLRRKATYQAMIHTLPDGCFVEIDDRPYLVAGDALALWTPAGYAEKRPRPAGVKVTVLTPEPAVRCIRAGYAPVIHESVNTAKMVRS
ncbi:MAG TPA: hypothetical protein VG297_18310 [Bryobacteraceae bacterium]|jgi:hypothetical protein|nr:hypothetical protein [Bryobacteraceae bacterium]